jgi:hypothetical protein
MAVNNCTAQLRKSNHELTDEHLEGCMQIAAGITPGMRDYSRIELYVSVMTDFVKENYSVICEIVCKSKLFAFILKCEELSIYCAYL